MNTDQFNGKKCEKIDALDVAAYMHLVADPDLPTGFILENSWGDTGLDLKDIIKAGETDTQLFLAPTIADASKNWRFLQYNSEDNVYCIEGEDLARIIPMTKLRDVDQVTAPVDGDVYMFDGNTDKFFTYNLKGVIAAINQELQDITTDISNLDTRMGQAETKINNLISRVTALEQTVSTLSNTVSNHETRITALETILTKPADVPAGVGVAWGNINVYGDHTNTDSRTHGVYTHSPNTTLQDDLYFA